MYDPVGDGKMAFPPSNALHISMSMIADMQFSLIGTCGGDGGGGGGDGGGGGGGSGGGGGDGVVSLLNPHDSPPVSVTVLHARQTPPSHLKSNTY